MFRLILIFLLFILFAINYFFSFLRTIPDFRFISHFNFYEYLIDKFHNISWAVTWINIKVADNDSGYVLDITWFSIITDLKYLSHKWNNFKIFIPVFILHTGTNIIKSWDNIFSWLNLSKNFWGYIQIISWWNNFIKVWEEIRNWKFIPTNLFLNYLYTYCSLSSTLRIDAYFFDRYKTRNNQDNPPRARLVPNTYVCPDDRTATWENCILWLCTTLTYCSCNDKWEYRICKNWADWNCDTNKNNWLWKCINYYTWSINLNSTNCSLANLTWNSIYFKLR